MDVKLLGMHGTELMHYSSNPEKAILFLLQNEPTLIMEPGELADFAKGQKFLIDSKATIIVLDKGDYCMVKESEYAHIFMPVSITEESIIIGAGYWRKTNPVRRVSANLPKGFI